MTKRIFTAMSLLALTAAAFAKPVTPEEALRRASDRHENVRARSGATVRPQLVHTSLTENGAPAVYVFNNSDCEGYLVLSADDEAIPMLGYADSGEFPVNDIPPHVQWWLSEYARQIEYVTAHPSTASAIADKLKTNSRAGREPIAPQIKTSWDQVEPYNDACPLSGTARTYTGCVATAMAQVMNYWKYPERGQGNISYTIPSLSKKVSLNFALKAFEWDKMLDSYIAGNYTDEQAAAVAYLMKACGYGVKMDYSTDSSGALAMNIANALVKYFNYDGNMLYTLRDYYSTTEWETLIYDNLKNVGPILYGGGSMLGGGHSFVCDGYDGNGYFHFNWGWSGMSDGYFSLDALNPDALGSGGGSGGGYNFTQDAVLGIQPPTGKPVEERPLTLTQMGTLNGEIVADSLKFELTGQSGAMWVNYNPATLRVKFTAKFIPQDGTSGGEKFRDVSSKRFSIEAGYGTSPDYFDCGVLLSEVGLSDGTYKVEMGLCPVTNSDTGVTSDGTGWIAMKECYGYSNSFVLRKSGSTYTVDNTPLVKFNISGELMYDLYYGCANRVKVTVENPSDIEMTSGFAPIFANASTGELLFLGESVFLTLPPHSTVTREWETPIYLLQNTSISSDTRLIFSFFDESTYNIYGEEFAEYVTMHATPRTTVSLTKNPSIQGARISYLQGESGLYRVYNVTSNEFTVNSTVKLTEGYFAYPVMACACTPSSEGGLAINAYAGNNMFLTRPGQSEDFSTVMNFQAAVPGQIYYLIMAYEGPSGLVPISMSPTYFRILDQSGINDIEAELAGVNLTFDKATSTVSIIAEGNVTEVSAVNIAGMPVSGIADYDGTRASFRLADGLQGVVLVTARDDAGNTKTIKVLL